MEKSVPHYKLPAIKNLIEAGKVRSTISALTGGAALGLDFDGIISVIKSLTRKDFYKSMTTHADHRVWQDVYRPSTQAGEVYMKITVVDDLLIVSFKEL
jgi:motility quorum-sensing regulator/GCU-specific mRNA interferase toxin